MAMLTIRIDEKLEADLERIAATQHLSKSDVARQMLRNSLILNAFDEVRRGLVPLAERAGYLTDEDVFRDVS